jgi:4'-phosphopantetheinyl transferase
VDVWIASERLLDDLATCTRFSAMLSEDELQRRDQMKTESVRRQQLLTRALQRDMLSRYEPKVAPHEWRFVRSPTGRPSLAPPFDATGLHFNLAHTQGLVAMAIGRVPQVGVDLESVGKRVPLAVAKRYFSDREVTALEALPPEQQPARFLRLWTLKEAYLKATGTGIAGGLGRMTFTFGEGGVSFERPDDPQAHRWVFREFNPDGYVLALAFLDTTSAVMGEPVLREYLPDADSGQEQRAQP